MIQGIFLIIIFKYFICSFIMSLILYLKGKKMPPPKDDEQVIVTKPANFGTGNLATKMGKMGKNDTKIEV